MALIINISTYKFCKTKNDIKPIHPEFIIMPSGYIEMWWCHAGIMISKVGSINHKIYDIC